LTPHPQALNNDERLACSLRGRATLAVDGQTLA
jgi:hypothetical protein